jgi:hypothetical protein
MLVCALLEDVAVLENLNAILSVPGISGFCRICVSRHRATL